MLISEIFEPRTRSVGICLAVIGGTVLAAVTAGFGPYAQQLGYSNCLWVFATMGAFSLFQLYVDLPETTDSLARRRDTAVNAKTTGVLFYVACCFALPLLCACWRQLLRAASNRLNLIHLRGPDATVAGYVNLTQFTPASLSADCPEADCQRLLRRRE